MVRFPLLLIILLGIGPLLYSQNGDAPVRYSSQWEFSHDNDYALFTDRYYSSGLFLAYRTLLKKTSESANSHQLDFKIGQEVYTPSQTQSVNTDNFDRPYAGFLGLSTRWSVGSGNQLINTSLLVGLAGLNSGAGGFQRWFHRVVSIVDSPLWIGELNDSFHLNLNFNYIQEWVLSSNPFGLRFALDPEIALGSRDIFFEPSARLFLGKKMDAAQSIAYGRLGTKNTRELYLSLDVGYRFVLHNGLIEGNLFGDDSPLLKDPENSVLRFGLNFNHRFHRNDIKIGLQFNSKETPEARSHHYLSLGYGLSF